MRPNRRGSVILEVQVALLGLVLLAAASRALVRNQRTWVAASERVEAREAALASLDALASELRELAPPDILEMAADEVEVRSPGAFGVVCGGAANAPGEVVVIPWGGGFEAGDSVVVLVEDGAADAGETGSRGPGWIRAEVVRLEGAVRCGARTAQALGLSPTWPPSRPPSIRSGAVVRAFTPSRLGLVRVAGTTFVGRTTSTGVVEPLAGPVGARVEDGAVLRLRYLDALGGPTGIPAEVAQIEMALRTPSSPGGPSGGDAVVSRVHLRN